MIDNGEGVALREMVDRLVKYLASMPDAGLTEDDPRLAWYLASVPLRAEAMDLLGQKHYWHSASGRWVRSRRISMTTGGSVNRQSH